MLNAHPDESGSDDLTIADIVRQSGGSFDHDGSDFDILLQALQAADLVDAVADPGADLTVFAPTDDAFVGLVQSLGADVADGDEAGAFGAIVDGLTALSPDSDPIPLLQNVLLYHVSAGGKTLDEIKDAGEVETLLGSTFQVEKGELIDADPTLENPRFVEGRPTSRPPTERSRSSMEFCCRSTSRNPRPISGSPRRHTMQSGWDNPPASRCLLSEAYCR